MFISFCATFVSIFFSQFIVYVYCKYHSSLVNTLVVAHPTQP